MTPFSFGDRSDNTGGGIRRVNAVAVAILLGWVVVGISGWLATASPIPPVAAILVGLVLMQSP